MKTARIVSYNADHYDPYLLSGDKYLYTDTAIKNRFERIPGLLAALEPDVVLVQELYGTDQAEVENSARHLSRATGLACEWQGQVAAAKSVHHHLGTGILWGPRFKPEAYERLPNFWQPLNIVHGSVDGLPLAGASHHAQSVGKVNEFGDLRFSDTRKLVAVAKDRSHIILGGDWNGSAAARQNDSWLDAEPAPEVPLQEVMDGREVDFVLDRGPASILHNYGLEDLAAYHAMQSSKLPETTTGGRPTREGPQRLDRLYAWKAMARRVCSVTVIKGEEAAMLSDHYPIVVELDTARPQAYL